ncbi:MAG: tRNA (guanosine(37)-N1)-methyltransferase TrmD [Chloroflexi bacterium]|nr:tRNA (guanosine(37)-N1)-methyltransferase TrmD [Chloroflexota bacterium]
MIIHILTLFPNMFQGPFSESIVKRAQEQALVEIRIHNLRDFTHDRHHTADDSPYGGGPGMVLKPEPFFEGVETIQAGVRQRRGEGAVQETPVILLAARGSPFSQAVAEELSRREEIILLCGHYEGVDERVAQHLATHEVTIGGYVLTGGELPAMVVVDAVVRLLPGALHDMEAARDDSYTTGLLQYPHYTRPAAFRGWAVPEVLLSGNHQEVARWRRQQALLRTLQRRPDLLAKASLNQDDARFLQTLRPQGPTAPDASQAPEQRPMSQGDTP